MIQMMNQQSIADQQNLIGLQQILSQLNHREDNQEVIQQQQEDLEQGEMNVTKLSIQKPLYKQITPTYEDKFYMSFYKCIDPMKGQEVQRYNAMKNRFNKFFLANTRSRNLEYGQRWSRRIQPNYTDKQTYPLSYAVMIYGVDFLSNKEVKQILKIKDIQKERFKRINLSNVAIMFLGKQNLQQIIKPYLYDKEGVPFFQPKKEQLQEEDQMEQQQDQSLRKLPRGWYGLKPYPHKDHPIFWFIRYLTNQQSCQLNKIKQEVDFIQTYKVAKNQWQRKQKYKEDSSAQNTSRMQVISRSKDTQSVNAGSVPQRRERSRQKRQISSKDFKSQNLDQSAVLSGLQLNQNQHNQNNQIHDQSMDMSFVYRPQNKNQIKQMLLQKQSQQMLQMLNDLSLCGEGKYLQDINKNNIVQLDDDDDNMQMVTQGYDPNGLSDKLIFNRKNRIQQLTQIKVDQRFNYNEYVQKIMQAEQDMKECHGTEIITLD